MSRAFTYLSLSFLACITIFNGCQSTCSNLPNQALASVRIMNAIPNVDTLNVYLDGKLFEVSFYELGQYGLGTNASDHVFGYRQTYLSDGSGLSAGTHHIVATIAGSPKDTVFVTDMPLRDHRQTLMCIGRYGSTVDSIKPKILYLDDNVQNSDPTKSLVRFVHGVIDLKGLDVYFSKSPKYDASHHLKPDLRIGYGQISDAQGGGSGTGISSNDYITIPASDGLLITSVGDTTNTILQIPYAFFFSGFLATIVIRGESQPLDHDPTVSTVVLEDGSQGSGTYNADLRTYGVRLANATHLDSLSLLILGSADKPGGPPRNNIPSQEKALNIHQDSVGDYLPLNPLTHGNAEFWFSKTPDAVDTIYAFHKISNADERYTFIAIDSTPRNSGTPKYGVLILHDTLSLPTDPGYGRVRFVSTSPDHAINFSFSGHTYSLRQQDIAVNDAPTGHYSITVSDGGQSDTIEFDLNAGIPITVFFMPASSTKEFPYAVTLR